jgi:hypothetical protein
MTTTTKTLRYGKGYSGKLGNKCWIAEITGTDDKYGLKRVFLEPSTVEREHFNRSRTIVNFSYELGTNGLYELSEGGERQFVGMFADEDSGAVKWMQLSDARVKAWAAALDEGKSDSEARVASEGL